MIRIPERMRHLKLSQQGYPIFYTVLVDDAGVPHFAAADERKRLLAIRKGLCGICGGGLFRGRWFVGGALSAFHPQGAFRDPPMHSECAHYSLLACPYLSAPRYMKEVGMTKLKNAYVAEGKLLSAVDPSIDPGRPRGDLFIAIMATRYTDDGNYIKPVPPYKHVEYWRHGREIPKDEGVGIVRDALIAHANAETKGNGR